jgi:hypothetical protein
LLWQGRTTTPEIPPDAGNGVLKQFHAWHFLPGQHGGKMAEGEARFRLVPIPIGGRLTQSAVPENALFRWAGAEEFTRLYPGHGVIDQLHIRRLTQERCRTIHEFAGSLGAQDA